MLGEIGHPDKLGIISRCWIAFKRIVFSEDVLGVSEIQTKQIKSVNDVKEKEKEGGGRRRNQDTIDNIESGPVTKKPSVWYFQEISPDKRKIKVPQSQIQEALEVATQTEDVGNSEVEMRLVNLEKSISHVLLELRWANLNCCCTSYWFCLIRYLRKDIDKSDDADFSCEREAKVDPKEIERSCCTFCTCF